MDQKTLRGLLAAGGAFLLWGVLPIYWKGVISVGSLEVLCHRVGWSAFFVAGLIALQKRWPEVRKALTTRSTCLALLLSSILIGINWFLYIWSVLNNHVVEASLGYYINPLVNVVLGFVFFRDRLRPLQLGAVALACMGVGWAVWVYGSAPWVALALAFSFGFYGLVRKVVPVEPMPGLFVETLLLSPLAWGYILYLLAVGRAGFLHQGPAVDLLLLGAGVATSTPLMLFARGARNLRLATLGIMQYISPSCMLLLGVFAYGEPFGTDRMVTFLFIWAGIALYVAEGFRSQRELSRVLDEN